jgi:hypothetical protein
MRSSACASTMLRICDSTHSLAEPTPDSRAAWPLFGAVSERLGLSEDAPLQLTRTQTG